MYTDGYSSDLEVVSKDMANLEDSIDSKLASPEQEVTEMDATRPEIVKLDTRLTNGHSIGSVFANGNGTNPVTSKDMTPEDYSADPMLASALMSPLHDPLSMDAMFASTKPELLRAPTILQRAHSIGNDWELYKRAGPKYPVSMDQLIMKYHQKHSNSWQLAHDFGAGSGAYAATLARFFRHIHISDPTTTGLSISRNLLSKWSSENPKKRGRFTFSVCKPELAEECAGDGSVDMAIMTESAHFTEAETMVRSVGRTLAPGGTLVIITHRPISKVAGNPQVAEAVERLFRAWGKRPWEVACSTESKPQQQFSLGLDFVPLPDDVYDRELTRRITINAHSKPTEMFRVPGADDHDITMSTDEMMEMATSRANEKEKRIAYGMEDEQARGWRFEVGWESFRTRVAMLDTPETIARLEPHLTEIKELIMKTSPNGVTVVIEWAVAVILATKK